MSQGLGKWGFYLVFLGFGRERERQKQGKKKLIPLFLHVREKEDL
jgi:hypothetical protein